MSLLELRLCRQTTHQCCHQMQNLLEDCQLICRCAEELTKTLCISPGTGSAPCSKSGKLAFFSTTVILCV